MKKLTIVIIKLSLAACGRESSPEGRPKIRDEKIQIEIDDLKDRNNTLLDSISIINKELKQLRGDNMFK